MNFLHHLARQTIIDDKLKKGKNIFSLSGYV